MAPDQQCDCGVYAQTVEQSGPSGPLRWMGILGGGGEGVLASLHGVSRAGCRFDCVVWGEGWGWLRYLILLFYIEQGLSTVQKYKSVSAYKTK